MISRVRPRVRYRTKPGTISAFGEYTDLTHTSLPVTTLLCPGRAMLIEYKAKLVTGIDTVIRETCVANSASGCATKSQALVCTAAEGAKFYLTAMTLAIILGSY
jgi:hypothetical protein